MMKRTICLCLCALLAILPVCGCRYRGNARAEIENELESARAENEAKAEAKTENEPKPEAGMPEQPGALVESDTEEWEGAVPTPPEKVELDTPKTDWDHILSSEYNIYDNKLYYNLQAYKTIPSPSGVGNNTSGIVMHAYTDLATLESRSAVRPRRSERLLLHRQGLLLALRDRGQPDGVYVAYGLQGRRRESLEGRSHEQYRPSRVYADGS